MGIYQNNPQQRKGKKERALAKAEELGWGGYVACDLDPELAATCARLLDDPETVDHLHQWLDEAVAVGTVSVKLAKDGVGVQASFTTTRRSERSEHQRSLSAWAGTALEALQVLMFKDIDVLKRRWDENGAAPTTETRRFY